MPPVHLKRGFAIRAERFQIQYGIKKRGRKPPFTLLNVVYDSFFAGNEHTVKLPFGADQVNSALAGIYFNNTSDSGAGGNEGKEKGCHGSVAWVKTTRVFVVCCLQYYVDAPDSKRHKGTEADSQSEDVVVHDTVSQEGIGVPLFQTNTPGLVSSLS